MSVYRYFFRPFVRRRAYFDAEDYAKQAKRDGVKVTPPPFPWMDSDKFLAASHGIGKAPKRRQGTHVGATRDISLSKADIFGLSWARAFWRYAVYCVCYDIKGRKLKRSELFMEARHKMQKQYITLYKLYLRERGETGSQQEKILEKANLRIHKDMPFAPPSPYQIDNAVPTSSEDGTQAHASPEVTSEKDIADVALLPVTHSAVLVSLVDLETRSFLSDVLMGRCIAEEEIRIEKQCLKAGKNADEIQKLVGSYRRDMDLMLDQLSTLKEAKQQIRKVKESTLQEERDALDLDWWQRTVSFGLFFFL
jgi:hypothetical protein